MGKGIEETQISIFEYAHIEDPAKTCEQETFEEVFGINFKVVKPIYTQISLEEYMGGHVPMIKVSDDTPSPEIVICNSCVETKTPVRTRTSINKIGFKSRNK